MTKKLKPASGKGRHLTRDPEKLKGEMISRMVASECGLHRICIYRLCRRHKRCLGPRVMCIKSHRGLFQLRFPRVIANWPE
jgi:hypothetical protein